MQTNSKHSSLDRWSTTAPRTKSWNLQWRSKKISLTDMADTFHQLSTLLHAGIPLTKAIEMLAHEHTHSSLKIILINIKQKIESGKSFSEAVQGHPQIFSSYMQHMITLGENTGTLEKTLGILADSIEKQLQLKNKLFNALFYPTCVLVCSLLITAALLIFIVPRFANLYANFNATLPFFTRVIIIFGTFLSHYSWIAVLLLILISFSIRFLNKRSTRFNVFLHSLFLNLFLFGTIIKHNHISRITHTLFVYYNAGMPLAKALDNTCSASNNRCYQIALAEASKQVTIGHKLSTTFNERRLFPSRVEQMIKVGEESGSLSTMLEKTSEYYSQQFERSLNYLNKLLEPLMMIIISLLIGGIMIAMYLPLFKIGTIV